MKFSDSCLLIIIGLLAIIAAHTCNGIQSILWTIMGLINFIAIFFKR